MSSMKLLLVLVLCISVCIVAVQSADDVAAWKSPSDEKLEAAVEDAVNKRFFPLLFFAPMLGGLATAAGAAIISGTLLPLIYLASLWCDVPSMVLGWWWRFSFLGKPCITTCTKFMLLMWKDALLQYRKPFPTIMEIIVMPIVMTTLLVALRSVMAPENMDARLYTPFCPVNMALMCDQMPNGTLQGSTEQHGVSPAHLKEFDLAYAPTGNSAIDKSMKLFKSVFANVNSYANERDMEEHFLTSDRANLTLAAIVFDHYLKDGTELPDDTEVKIRFPGELKTHHTHSLLNDWKTNTLFPKASFAGPRDHKQNFGAEPAYYDEGFLALQTMLTYFLIYGQLDADLETINDGIKPLAPTVKMQRFPHASWIEDPVKFFMAALVGLVMTCAFYYTFTRIVAVITIEKEKQLKESMKIMGLPNWLHWTAWFCKSFVFLSIAVLLIVILLKVPCKKHHSILTHTNPLVIYLFFLLYISSVITFAFACSSFFSKASSAAFISQLLYIATYVPHLLMQSEYATMNLPTKLVFSLGMNSAMAFGFDVMFIFEETGEGIQWHNLFGTGTPDNNLTLGYVMLMLIVDTLLYLFVALYMEAVFPGEYGVPQPWNYLFTSTYWRRRAGPYVDQDSVTTPNDDSEFFEKEPDSEAGVQIQNLRKMYGHKAAVHNLSLNMYKDQITVLLGHNGAGKTTTMSMLTGMFPPTSGTATVAGHDIRTDMDGARSSMGLCLQHNVLFDDLTVREHLIFFTKLKGVKWRELDRQVENSIELLELVPKAKAKSCKLSGGMKRKLCIGIALCGNSQVVMLDEPTAGMDPSARRSIWDLIQKQKEGRTILLTTHFMDEADLLGDRIAIMVGGELRCCGSSFFLKKKFGTGYRLIIDKDVDCDPDHVTRTLKSYIPSIEIHSDVGSELTYILDENEVGVFADMLKHLEDHDALLGVKSYGISVTTLEEVFMKVGVNKNQKKSYKAEQPDKKRKWKMTSMIKTGAGVKIKKSSATKETKLTMGKHDQLLSGCKLIENQFSAMCKKRMLALRRNWIWLLVQFLVPVVFLSLGFFRSRMLKETGDLPELSLSLKSYDHPITLIENNADSRTTEIRDVYVDLLTMSNEKMENVDSISDVMFNYTDKVPLMAKRRYIVGASFNGLEPSGDNKARATVIAWFNNEPYHSPPLALGMALNSVYKYMLKKRIRFANHPLPFQADAKIKRLSGPKNIAFLVPFYLTFGLACISGVHLLFYVRERVCKSKHLQLVSGVKIYVFWLSAFLCDLATFFLISLEIIVTLYCFQEDGFSVWHEIGRFSLILLYYGVALLPLIYIVSFWFEVPTTAMGSMTAFFLLIGVIGYTMLNILDTSYPDLVFYFDWILLIEPHYSLATGIGNIYITYSTEIICTNYVKICTAQQQGSDDSKCWVMVCNATENCCEKQQNYFKLESPGIGWNLCYSFGLGTAMALLLMMKEYKCFAKQVQHTRPDYVPAEDSDVEEEQQKICESSLRKLRREYVVVLRNLTKHYKKTYAVVNNISLGIKKYECFGLLGVNGAGKTTTFRMMTGDVKITGGHAWIAGYNIATQPGKVQKHIGYCPQFDALLDDLTVKETLVIFALLRGVPKYDCSNLAKKLAVEFDFRRHLHKQIKKLSGGSKRKVSTAVSMIGDPPVIFLDEPTTGMDPMTKRNFWNVLCRVRDSGKCIVLTSHSMEECEALCTRLVIIVDGSFKCLGSVQHLKNKFAAGYTLTIKVNKASSQSDDNMQKVEEFIVDNFPNAQLRQRFQEMLTFSIEDEIVTWSQVFGVLEQAKKDLDIEDYSLGQANLEQVFLSFTNSH